MGQAFLPSLLLYTGTAQRSEVYVFSGVCLFWGLCYSTR